MSKNLLVHERPNYRAAIDMSCVQECVEVWQELVTCP